MPRLCRQSGDARHRPGRIVRRLRSHSDFDRRQHQTGLPAQYGAATHRGISTAADSCHRCCLVIMWAPPPTAGHRQLSPLRLSHHVGTLWACMRLVKRVTRTSRTPILPPAVGIEGSLWITSTIASATMIEFVCKVYGSGSC